ncbi:MAG TPA: hypothetical protein VH020_02975 [Stellaceae bacterium]|jgi:hypothetical protein|nr:hypothetical protein [Stellaceae bacterium]
MARVPFGAAIVLMAGAFALSGCGWFGGGEKKLVCPGTYIAPDTDKEAVFKPGGTTLKDVSYGVQVASVKSECQRGEKGLIVDTKVGFRLVSNDPRLRTGDFEYFVSIVDAQQNILTKQTYRMPFEFGPRLEAMTKQDELIENLPLNDSGTGGNYAVVVGLQLTAAQLEFNRASSRPPTMSLRPSVAMPTKSEQGELSTPRP